MSAPYMPLYVGDYMRDTRGLTAEQHGAYLLLLMSMWNAGGSLPADDQKLARFASCTTTRWAKIKGDIISFFVMDAGEITHRRLTTELKKAQEKSFKRANAGMKGGKAKSLKDKESAMANAVVEPCHSSEPEKKERTKAGALDAELASAAPSFIEKEREPYLSTVAAVYGNDRDRVWGEGKAILLALGMGAKPAGSLIGKWLRDCGDDPSRLLAAIRAAEQQRTEDPIPFITKTLQADRSRSYDNRRRERSSSAAAADMLANFEALGPCPDDHVVRSPVLAIAHRR